MAEAVEQAVFRSCLIDICGLLANETMEVTDQGYDMARRLFLIDKEDLYSLFFTNITQDVIYVARKYSSCDLNTWLLAITYFH